MEIVISSLARRDSATVNGMSYHDLMPSSSFITLWKIVISEGIWFANVFPTWTRNPTITMFGFELETVTWNGKTQGINHESIQIIQGLFLFSFIFPSSLVW